MAETDRIEYEIDFYRTTVKQMNSQAELVGSFVLNYQEFLYNSIADTFDFSKMWDMSHFSEYDMRLKNNQTRKFTFNLS